MELSITTCDYFELTASSHLLQTGGCMVLKAYTQFERPTAALLFLLGHCFDQLDICKPGTSKAANGETYFIGQGEDKITGVTRRLF